MPDVAGIMDDAILHHYKQNTLEQYLANAKKSGYRNHLGASLIGKKCTRHLWYTFRWCFQEDFPGRLIRLFYRGDREEPVVVGTLKAAGAQVVEKAENGAQYRASEVEGHFGGSCDGFVYAAWLSAAWWLLEIKTANEKQWTQLKKKGVFKHQFHYYVQMQIYMHLFGVKDALFISVNKNTDAIYTEMIAYDQPLAERYLDRARSVVYAKSPPPKLSEQPSWYECKFCDAHGICHQQKEPAINCRTCAHSVPALDGKWICEGKKSGHREITDALARTGCEQHIFNPYLLPEGQLIEAVNTPDENWMKVRINGREGRLDGGAISSSIWPALEADGYLDVD